MSLLNDIYKESPTKAKSRLNIIDNAYDLFSVDGFDSFSLTDISQMSGITIRNLYRYYSSKEGLITDVAFHYISTFNSINPITLDITLTGYEQLRDVLQKQIEHKLLSVVNQTMITFIAYFDIYMTKANLENKAIKNYIKVYAPLLKANLLDSVKLALTNGVKDNTLRLEMFEVNCYVGYIYHSLMSLMSRIAVKRYEIEIQKHDFIQKHIDILLQHLKK
ncbi:MAG: TetR/AcrR family transcriptional regulator [Tenericutes bacterium]|nr:TetR/AcrR family transcriptional regulator [Mycoplasmatota bacterium]